MKINIKSIILLTLSEFYVNRYSTFELCKVNDRSVFSPKSEGNGEFALAKQNS